jgi:hypothetical protein
MYIKNRRAGGLTKGCIFLENIGIYESVIRSKSPTFYILTVGGKAGAIAINFLRILIESVDRISHLKFSIQMNKV